MIIATDPTNAELRYNLGVGFAKNGEADKALEQYKKALELDPNYAAAQINIAAIKLGQEGVLVEEMNTIRFGGFKLGFWFAQQGSIYFFVLIILVYIKLMNKLDKKYGVNE